MKLKIQHLIVGEQTTTFCTTSVYIVDYTKSTSNKRELEAFSSNPEGIEAFHINNQPQICVEYAPFASNVLLNVEGKEIEHCECVLFPEAYVPEKSWILFLEMKYREVAAKSSGQLKKASDQLFSTLQFFRDHGFISSEKLVYLIISFPKRKQVPFENSLFTPTQLQTIRREQKAILRGINEVKIIDDQKLKV